jgi:hypothetical protein
MLTHRLTHKTDNDDDPETNLFYQALIDHIDDLTHLANDNGEGLEMEWDEDRSVVTVRRV